MIPVAPRRILLLGSTGSIGRSTLDVVARYPERFRVVGLAAGSDHRALLRQARRFGPEWVAVADECSAKKLGRLLSGSGIRVIGGADASRRLVEEAEADVVVAAIVGAAGLPATYQAVRLGRTVALANKETLVMAGGIVMEAARRSGAAILPVDSEHHAVAAALRGIPAGQVAEVIITASGGPFLNATRTEMRRATPAQALRHPRWSMGAKISIDSATMMNKGLEVIEASWLFELPEDRIRVVVHPESVVHGMVRTIDGGITAYLSATDMRLPIAAALAHPEMLCPGSPAVSLERLGALSFGPPDNRRFPALELARAACRAGGTAPAVLNAANEVAVDAFLAGKITFPAIAGTVERVLESHTPVPAGSLETVTEADGWARTEASRIIDGRKIRPTQS